MFRRIFLFPHQKDYLSRHLGWRHCTMILTKEDEWLDSLVDGLQKLTDKMALKGEVRFIFPGNLLLTKTIRVPHVDTEKQRKIVAFELSQKMPFPLPI